MNHLKQATLASTLVGRIVDPEMRPDKPIWHNGTLYITDGRILVVMPDQPEWEGCWRLHGEYFSAKPDAKWGRVKADSLFALSQPKQFAPYLMPQVDGPPDGVDALWQSMQECDECRGFGWRECNMGHQHDCEYCGGDGRSLAECSEAEQAIEVGDVKIKRRYAWIVLQLPAVVIGKCPDMQALAFRFNEGHGLVMGMK